MNLKKSPLLLLILTLLFIVTGLGFAFFKQTKVSPSKENVTKENWLQDPYLRWSYTHMKELALTSEVKNSSEQVSPFPTALQNLDDFSVKKENGSNIPLKKLLDENKTDAFVVIHNGKLVYEQYFNGYKQNEPHGMASLAKVFTGALVQSLTEEGLIDVNKTAETYVKELRNTPFGKATIQQLMDMQISAEYPTHGYIQLGLENQDAQLYLASNILPRGKNYNGPMKIYDMLREAKETASPGTAFSYNNGSSETLGWIIRTVTGKSLAENVSERIWSKIGMEENAYYVTDETGVEQASAGLNATARDMARFGQLILNNGHYNGMQMLPSSIPENIKSIQEGELPIGPGAPISYHNQWWIPHNEQGAFEVLGSYGQCLYIDPTANMVIVHFSSNASPSSDVHSTYSNMYIQIAKHLEKLSQG
ncbi:serine hydrolase domain-containing protein [Bacillus pseudomycoides]|uniref:serine hydrolase domain-containing protein n=1 Tax=Bacillus pseudomycoides TaxID=64104 RepID=UPI000BEBD214|nr:serine hydrolase domain-containing protein [Bacillus pseudomycoides]PED07181.1 6-aminohexanoate hydrolase [Bacillus pseudomycoides]PEI89871.1 6-aminohexanoate hydrolase [Bacillus pseudomycoides]PEK28891.1 6-aminohexanoate hydrolase [Bacillus pseudomycoides]PEM78879.1 6-aminohexanoate hydrolase [Bacillus pseudomycoides]PEO21981.1 6-aminohexanoate hydrolase [Bacillus pseudomycoides]